MARKNAKTGHSHSVQKILIRNTADVRLKVLMILQQVEDKEISLSEARVHIAGYRALLDSMKVEIAMAHLQNTLPGPVSMVGKPIPMLDIPEHKKQ